MEYLVARTAGALVAALPEEAAVAVGKLIGWLSYQIDRRHVRVALKNLRMVYGRSMGRLARRALVRRVYDHLGQIFCDLARMSRVFHGNGWRRRVRLVNFERVGDALRGGRPVIFVTAHIGNWDVAGAVIGQMHPPFYSIARTMDNRLLDSYMDALRESVGIRILKKHGSMRKVLEILRGGGRIAVLVDQNAPVDNLFVPFLGREAAVVRSVAALALKTGAAILPGYSWRSADGFRYVVEVGEPILPRRDAEREAEMYRLTEAFTRQVENWVRKHPEQWLWGHRRWKTRPPWEGNGS